MPGNRADLAGTELVDPPRVFVQGEGRNFHAAVAARRKIAANAVERPADIRFVAERELHATPACGVVVRLYRLHVAGETPSL
jgi:hypothetical protein